MRRSSRIHLFFFAVLLLPFFPAQGEIRLPAMFTDGMMLQRDQAAPIWGWAEPGELVTVTANNLSAEITAGDDGRWQVRLRAMPAQREPMDIRIDGSAGGGVVVHNVLVGDVWLCSGPSNIFWPVSKCDNAEWEIAHANYPELRFFMVEKATADKPQEDCTGAWSVCSPETVGGNSGIAYFVARRIHKELDIPVGVLQSFWGGSRMEAWTSLDALKASPGTQPVLAAWDDEAAGYPAAKKEYEKELEAWQKESAKAKREGRKAPAKPKAPGDPATSQHRPASLYNAMIAPLIPYGIRAAMIYQGNGNLLRSQHSTALLTTQIEDWRARWGLGSIPFGLVQPAPFEAGGWANDRAEAYCLVRETQLRVMDQLPNIGLALTMDMDAINILHPTNKQLVGKRMAQWALSEVYGRPTPYLGPIYDGMKIEGGKIRVLFKNTGAGLSTSDGKAPAHFVISGSDGKFHPAKAVIDGHTVLVESSEVPQPTAVRFAWRDADVVNLINSDGLPACLFRSDGPS